MRYDSISMLVKTIPKNKFTHQVVLTFQPGFAADRLRDVKWH